MCRHWPFPLYLCTDDPQCGCVRTWVGGPLANRDCSHKPEHIEPLGALQSWPRSHDLFTPHVDTRHCTHAPATAHLGPELCSPGSLSVDAAGSGLCLWGILMPARLATSCGSPAALSLFSTHPETGDQVWSGQTRVLQTHLVQGESLPPSLSLLGS